MSCVCLLPEYIVTLKPYIYLSINIYAVVYIFECFICDVRVCIVVVFAVVAVVGVVAVVAVIAVINIITPGIYYEYIVILKPYTCIQLCDYTYRCIFFCLMWYRRIYVYRVYIVCLSCVYRMYICVYYLPSFALY